MEKISFCINTAVNEINHVKLLFSSLEKNLSSKEHEFIVFIDSDNQGTFEWLLTQKEIFPNLKILKNIAVRRIPDHVVQHLSLITCLYGHRNITKCL